MAALLKNKILKKYTTVSEPASFSGLSTFTKELSNQKKLSPKDKLKIKDTLLNEEFYTLHTPALKKFPRNKVLVKGINDTFQVDLIDVTNIAQDNDNYKFILTCIDVFSKYGWAIPIKNKTANEVVKGFTKIFESGRIPNKIQSDAGQEFLNKQLYNYLKTIKSDLKLYTINSEMKASVVERFNRTIKQKMWRYFTHKQSYRYIDIIDDLMKSYNSTYHRTIKNAPIKINKSNEKETWFNIYGYNKNEVSEKIIDFKFKVGDLVRISKTKLIFQKGYTPNWSREIFKIHQQIPRIPPVYKIIDIHPTNPEIVDGVFYEQQLQKIEKHNDVYYVDKILNTRTNKGKKEVYIQWLGYPTKFNSWEPASNFVDFKNNIDINPTEDNERIKFSI